MSLKSRARRLQAVVSISYQQALDHLSQFPLTSARQTAYIEQLEGMTGCALVHCGECNRSHFGFGSRDESCPFCSAVAEVVEWFFDHYKDPADGVPHDSGEGGYQYVNGGPYDPYEVIDENFEDESQEVRETASQRVSWEVGHECVGVDEY